MESQTEIVDKQRVLVHFFRLDGQCFHQAVAYAVENLGSFNLVRAHVDTLLK